MSTPDRIFNAEARAIDAMVWIDGVEVPFSDIELSFPLDQPSRLAISIEPDEDLDLWRPKSRVHVWIRDPFPDKSRIPHEGKDNPESDQRDEEYDKNTYMLFWEGEVVAINDTETADNRQTVITAQDYWNIPANTDINLVDIGSGMKVAFINGSTFYGDIFSEGDGISADTSNLILGGMINYLFKDGEKAFAGGVNKINSGVTEIGRQLLLYLSQFNASFGLQAWRTNMFEKFTGIPDQSMKSFIRYSLLPVLMGQVQQMSGSPDVFSYFMEMISKFFHHTTTVPLPPLKEKDDIHRGLLERETDAWNELAIIPNLYYAFAPLCNWLFPENYTQRAVGRGFMEEPTRLGMSSISTSVAGFRTVHLAPEGLISYLNSQKQGTKLVPDGADSVTLGLLHGSREASIKPQTQADLEFTKRGFYLNPTANASDRVNLLDFLTPTELEKGILYTESQNAYQEFLGLARLNGSTEDDTQVKNALRKEARDQEAYTNFMRMLAQYELNFKQVSRHTQVSGIFNPWPVVGLPAMICREGRSYKGLLVGLSHRISYGGQASTSYEMAFTQLFRPTALSDLPEAQLKTAKKSLEDAVTIRKKELLQLLDDLQTRGLITETEKTALAEAGIGDIQGKLNELLDAEAVSKDTVDMDAASDQFLRYRRAFSDYVRYEKNGVSWLNAFDEYAGYVTGLAGTSARAERTVGSAQPSPDKYPVGKAAGGKKPADERTVIQDQLNEGAVDKPLAWVAVTSEASSGPLVTSFWADVVRGFRLVFEELRVAVSGYFAQVVQPDEPGYVLATSPAADIARNDRLAARVARVDKIDAEIEQLEEDKISPEELADDLAEIAREISSLEAQIPLSFQTSPGAVTTAELEAQIKDLENKKDVETQIAENTNKRKDEEIELLLEERAELRALNRVEPPVEYWNWQITLTQALRFFSTDSAVAAAASTSASISFGNFDSRQVTWQALLNYGGSQGTTAVTRVRALTRKFLEAYAWFYGDLANFDANAVCETLARDFKIATKFAFQTKLDRFADLTRSVMDRINSNYKTFTNVFSELTMELPPLMPFNNDNLTRLDKFDDTVRGMVKPREPEGHFKYWSDGASTAFVAEGLDTDKVFESLRQEVALRYDAYVRMAKKIFPFNAEDGDDAEYRRQVDKGTQLSWANKLQARKGVTMSKFLERTGLKLEQRSASDPDTFGKGSYYVAVAEGEVEDTDFNSYFSKLGRLSTEGSGDPDKFPLLASVVDIRKKAKDGSAVEWRYVRASVRQDLIEQYTKKHAVARAFRGRR